MNREIKFRVFDKNTKKMYSPTTGRACGVDYQVSFWDVGWELVEITAKGWKVLCSQDSDVRDDGVVMQFTGLKDKNGKEIFEDDILKTNRGIFEVFYRQEFAGFYCKKKDWIDLLTSSGRADNLELYEVIGNIWQDPELLER